MVENIEGYEVEVKRLTRAQIRDLRKSGYDIFRKSFELQKGIEELGPEALDLDFLDSVLDCVYSDQEELLDELGLTGRIYLAQHVLGSSMSSARSFEKKSEQS